jgi:hypothetical protein
LVAAESNANRNSSGGRRPNLAQQYIPYRIQRSRRDDRCPSPNKIKINQNTALYIKNRYFQAELDPEFKKPRFRFSSHLRHQGNIAGA